LGKNQYTRDRDLNDGDGQSPGRSQSRDASKADENGHSTNHRATNSDGKVGKSKGSNGPRITMLDMKRKVAAMLDFISRTQLEMASEALTPTNEEATGKMMRGLAGSIIPMLKASAEDTLANSVNGDEDGGTKTPNEKKGDLEKDFKDLTLLEMMDHLTGQLVKWQNQFV
jgi:hypothetical protein